MTASAPLDLPALLDDLERACPACAGAMPVHHMGAPLQAAHERHAAAVPTLIAELRKRDAALRAVEALAEEWETARDHHEAPILEAARELRAALAPVPDDADGGERR